MLHVLRAIPAVACSGPARPPALLLPQLARSAAPTCRKRLMMSCEAIKQHDSVEKADWSALASLEEGVSLEEDADFQTAFNDVCTRAIRIMLKGSAAAIPEFQSELNEIGNYCATSGNAQAATFIYVLYMLLEHKLAAAHEKLSGRYREALLKVLAILEDSGWKLVREGEEEDDDDLLDDELLQPPAGYGYMQ